MVGDASAKGKKPIKRAVDAIRDEITSGRAKEAVKNVGKRIKSLVKSKKKKKAAASSGGGVKKKKKGATSSPRKKKRAKKKRVGAAPTGVLRLISSLCQNSITNGCQWSSWRWR